MVWFDSMGECICPKRGDTDMPCGACTSRPVESKWVRSDSNPTCGTRLHFGPCDAASAGSFSLVTAGTGPIPGRLFAEKATARGGRKAEGEKLNGERRESAWT